MMEHTTPISPLRKDAVTVISCSDENFTAPTGVLFRSIMDHADPNRFYDLIYLHNGVNPALLKSLCAMAEGIDNISIRTFDIRTVFTPDGLHIDNRQDFSAMTFARLVIPEVMDKEYHRALYLDGDMMALRDVATLYDSDLDGKPLGSTVDFGFLSSAFSSLEQQQYAAEVLHLQKPDDYFMAAVLLMDLDQIRAVHSACNMMEVARSRAWIWHDQDVLNFLFHGQIRYLNPAWDVIVPEDGAGTMPPHWKKAYETALAAPYIFHFAGNHAKPWASCTSCYAPEFWEIARRTPFYEQLFARLYHRQGAYDRLYCGKTGGIRAISKKLLPPPAQSVQRDLRNVLDSLDEQTRMILMLMRQLAPTTTVPPQVQDVTIPIQPVHSNAVTLVCCGDENFIAPTGVLLQSVIDHADPARFYDIIYLHNGIRENSRNQLCAPGTDYPNISIRTCDIRPIFDENGLYTQNRHHFSPMAYARLMIADILGADYRRALYLDGDMIAFRDVAALFDSNLQGMPLGSSTDPFYFAQTDRIRRRYVENIVGVTNPAQYILSGMLLLDLELFRQENLSARLMSAARSRQWLYHDQDVINHVLAGRIRLLDMAWDCCDETTAPAIFHFAGGGAKPWERCCPPHAVEFWSIAGKTPFYTELLRRLHLNLNTYQTHYGVKGVKIPMFKRILKKFLPPPVESVQRDLKTVLNAMDEQKQLSLLLMHQLNELHDGDASGVAAKVPNRKLRFEFALAAHCNLNCAGCSHFSPLAQEEFPDFNESKRSFERLSQLFDGECEYIHLLGGEPLLNPQCEDYLCLTRSCFPKGDIFLVTNGLLLPKQSDRFYETCRDQRIIIAVTPYPITLNLDELREKCATFGVKFQLFGDEETKSQFNRLLLDPQGRQDAVANYIRCPYANVCLFLYKDRMYPCGIGAHMRIFDQHFSAGLQLNDADSVDIFSVRNGYDLLYQLAKPRPMCRYCRCDQWNALSKWHPSQRKIQEWV